MNWKAIKQIYISVLYSDRNCKVFLLDNGGYNLVEYYYNGNKYTEREYDSYGRVCGRSITYTKSGSVWSNTLVDKPYYEKRYVYRNRGLFIADQNGVY